MLQRKPCFLIIILFYCFFSLSFGMFLWLEESRASGFSGIPTMKPMPTMPSSDFTMPTVSVPSTPEMPSIPTAKPVKPLPPQPTVSSDLKPFESNTPVQDKDLVPYNPDRPEATSKPEPTQNQDLVPYSPDLPEGTSKPEPTQNQELVPHDPNQPGTAPEPVPTQNGDVAPYNPDSPPPVSDSTPSAASTPGEEGAEPNTAGTEEEPAPEIPVEFYIGFVLIILLPLLVYILSRRKKK